MVEKTKQTAVRLSEEDRERLEQIRKKFGLPSQAAAIRFAVREFFQIMEAREWYK